MILSEYQTLWSALSHNLAEFDSLKLPRFGTSEDSPVNFYIFCDASKGAYSFAAYSMQDGESHLAFTKAKVASMKPNNLPKLKLLAVFLPRWKTYSRIRIGDIVISVDAQVVSSWLLSDNIKAKNQFVKKDLRTFIKWLGNWKKRNLYQ